MQTEKKTKQRKTRRLIIVTLLFIEKKRAKKTKRKQRIETIRKTNQKGIYNFGKKNLLVCQEENSAHLLVMSTLIDPKQKKKI